MKWDLKSTEFVNFILVCCAQAKLETYHVPTDSYAELLKIHLKTLRSVYGHAQSNKRRLRFWMLYRFFKMADRDLSKHLEGKKFPQTCKNIFITDLAFQTLWLVIDTKQVCWLWFQKRRTEFLLCENFKIFLYQIK